MSALLSAVMPRPMFSMTTVFVLCGFAVAAGAVAPQEPVVSGVLQGRVLDARTGEPVSRAQITLTDATSTASRPPVIGEATSDSRGRFTVGGLGEGAYRVAVLSNGFARKESRVVISDGQVIDDLVVAVAPAGAISGRVYSTTGRPLPGARVSLQQRSYASNGTLRMSTVASVTTNDLGEYRMYWISPGRYYVMAEGNGSSIFAPDPRSDFLRAVRQGSNDVLEPAAPRYYPGVPDLTAASVIELGEGADLRGVDFALPPQQLHSIRGRLIDPATGESPDQATITLSQSNPLGGNSGGSSVSWYDRTTGTFEIPDLEPGTYGLSVTIGQPGFASFLGNVSVGPRAAAIVTVDESDLSDIRMEIRDVPAISGQVRIEGPVPEDFSPDRLRVRLMPIDSGAAYATLGALVVSVGAEATFSLPTSRFGEFRVTMSGLPEGFYLKAATLDGQDVLNGSSPFSLPGNLDVLLSASAGRVEGQVLDSEGRPAAAVDVVLIPDVQRYRTELYRRVMTDRDGRFVFRDVVPGNYQAFAWESVEGNAYFDDQALNRFEGLGSPVGFSESSQLTIEVSLIPGAMTP